MKAKKILASILSLAMVLGSISLTALADDAVNVAKIGDEGYASLDAALDAALKDGIKEVEITVTDDVAFSTKVANFDKVTFTGTNREQTIDLSINAAFNTNVELVFNNLTVSRLDSDWLYHYFYVTGGLSYNNCKMVGLFNVTAQDTDFIGCDFYNDDTFGDGNYSIWLYNCFEGVEVNITNCTFDVYERAIKMYGDGYTGSMTLNISNTEFESRTVDKTVVEMAYDKSTGTGSMDLNIVESTASGFGAPEHIDGDANAWFNVEGTDTVSTVKVDSEVVYTDVVPTGSITPGYTSQRSIWGEGGGNANESLVVKLYCNEDVIATASLNNIDGIIDGDVYVTWSIPLGGSNDGYWNVEWKEGYPNINAQPTSVEMVIDGVSVATNNVRLNGPDDLNKIVAATADSNGMINGYYTSLDVAFDAAVEAAADVTVTILEDVDLTHVDWAPVSISHPAGLVTVEGNNKTITGLNDMLFSGTWAGNSGLIINDLTIDNSTIVHDKDDSAGNIGVGAFIGYPQASETITLNNCHLTNSIVEGGHWTGGLIGMAGGYSGNDGPVFMNLVITDCSVENSVINGKGSVGGIIGHASCSAWTQVTIEDTEVKDNKITSTGDSAVKAGAVCGTVGAAGQPTTADGETKVGGHSINAVVTGNTVTSNGTKITTVYGRQGTATGTLEITGGTYDSNPISENDKWAAPADGYEIKQNTDGTYGVSLSLPTADVTDIPQTELEEKGAPDLTFALKFAAVEPTEAQLEKYKDWYADFELTVNKKATFNAGGEADGYLAGEYGTYGWISVPFEDVTLEAGDSLKIMEYAASLMGQPGLKITYNDVVTSVKIFNCGIYFTDEFIAKNPDLEVTLSLNMYNPEDETEKYTIGDTYKFSPFTCEWTAVTDSGYYMNGTNKEGLMRWLFLASINGTADAVGIEYQGATQNTQVFCDTVITDGDVVFYGDVSGFTKSAATKDHYSARGFVKSGSTTNYSDIVINTPNWDRELDYKGGNE